MRLGKTFCIVLVGMGLLIPAGAQASSWRYVEGKYAQAATCVPWSGEPTSNPTVWTFSCATGTTTWTDDLQGQTVLEDVRGTIDLTTGDIQGTAKETIHILTADGRTGALWMTSVFSTDGDTNTFEATNTILGGDGDFAGAKGTLDFYGMTIGQGDYSGWIKTKSKKGRRTARR